MSATTAAIASGIWGKCTVDALADILARAPASLPSFDDDDDDDEPILEREVEDGWISISTIEIPGAEDDVLEIDMSWQETRPADGDDYEDIVWSDPVFVEVNRLYADRYASAVLALDKLARAVERYYRSDR